MCVCGELRRVCQGGGGQSRCAQLRHPRAMRSGASHKQQSLWQILISLEVDFKTILMSDGDLFPLLSLPRYGPNRDTHTLN